MKATWKKIFSLALAAAMSLSLAACGQQSAPQQSQSQEAPQAPETSTSQPQTDAPQSDGDQTDENTSTAGGKTLVVYYSATGNTETVAGYIAEATGGDLFEITPAEPYTDADLNWTDEGSRVSREHDDPSLREMELTAATVENWDEYDTVFVGYPIWWGIAAWPVDAFINANDFTGKTVIPFATSSSSGLGESGELLAELAGTGDWQEGQRFRSGVNEADVTEWVNGLGLS